MTDNDGDSLSELTPEENSSVFDLSIPQQYLDAMAATDAKISSQMKVWETYISELGQGLNKLQTQMNMLSTHTLQRELSQQASLLRHTL